MAGTFVTNLNRAIHEWRCLLSERPTLFVSDQEPCPVDSLFVDVVRTPHVKPGEVYLYDPAGRL